MIFDNCECGGVVTAVWYEEEEFFPNSCTLTGRVRTAVSHLSCIECFSNFAVDDSFDRPWRENK